MDVLEDRERFETELAEVLCEPSADPSFNMETWFIDRLYNLLRISNCNFLWALLLIKKLQLEDEKYFGLRRIEEFLYTFVNERKNEDSMFLTEAVRFSDSQMNSDLIKSFMNIITSQNPSGGDLVKLFKAYKSSDPPSVAFLRCPDVIEPILIRAFDEGSPNQMAEKLFLVAYSAFWLPSDSCQDNIRLGEAKLTELRSLVIKITSMSQLQTHLRTFLELAEDPICATVITMWLKRNLFNDDFYEWTSLTNMALPAAFFILDEIVITLPSHRARVFEIWVALLDRKFDMTVPPLSSLVVMQYREKFVDRFVLLFQNQHEKAVLQYLACKDQIDPSLIVYFLNKVIPDLDMRINTYLYTEMINALLLVPPVTLQSSSSVRRLVAAGHHLDLDSGTLEKLAEIESNLS